MRCTSGFGLLMAASAFLFCNCSSSSGGGGTTHSDAGSSSGGGGSSSGVTGCSSVPQAVNSCSIYSGSPDAGQGMLQFCQEYSGNDAMQNPSQGPCGPMIPMMYGVASAGPCPTANRLGGVCLSCGGAPNLVIAEYNYTTGPYTTEAQVQKSCYDTYVP
jgi:hypothetical protein